ncbi:MAG: efflux RND transporter periplasmic adaptor subunit [Chitinophagaceae bacterium]|nr:MAG: efflux RND transporter periplasmic adaptor subunit [Chitinophagaceae bacterium]
MANKSIISIRTAFAGVALVSLLASCGGDEKHEEKKETPAAAAPSAREVVSLKKEKLSTNFRSPGELIAFQQVDLYAKEASFVKKLYVDVGSVVKAGQLLITMDAPEISSRLAAAESRVKSYEAIYQASKSNYDRLFQTSQTPGTISPNDLEQAAARKNSDLAQLEAARSAYKEITVTQGYLEIRAPFAGVISSRNVNPGAFVGPSGKGSEFPLFTVQQQDRLRLVVSVPEAYTGFLRNLDDVNFTVRSKPDQKFKAKIARLAGALDARLRSERVEMDVINNDKKLLPGMIAEVDIPMPARDSSFVVPTTAIVSSQEKVFVIRVKDNKAEWVPVTKGRDIDGRSEIFGKLETGDNVVQKANEEIRDGSEVKYTKEVAADSSKAK